MYFLPRGARGWGTAAQVESAAIGYFNSAHPEWHSQLYGAGAVSRAVFFTEGFGAMDNHAYRKAVFGMAIAALGLSAAVYASRAGLFRRKRRTVRLVCRCLCID